MFENTHTFAAAGTYTVTFTAWSQHGLAAGYDHDPYGSAGEAWRVTVVVQPAAPPPTTAAAS